MGENQFEIYLPGKRKWDTIESLKSFLRRIQKQFSFFKTGSYFVAVTTNPMGTLFEIECIEKYFYRKTVDFHIKLYHLPFYIRSKDVDFFRTNCTFFEGFFYGLSSSICSLWKCCEQVERISKQEYTEAIQKGTFIKKRRESSSL